MNFSTFSGRGALWQSSDKAERVEFWHEGLHEKHAVQREFGYQSHWRQHKTPNLDGNQSYILNIQFVPHRQDCNSITNNNWWILFKTVTVVYSENRNKTHKCNLRGRTDVYDAAESGKCTLNFELVCTVHLTKVHLYYTKCTSNVCHYFHNVFPRMCTIFSEYLANSRQNPTLTTVNKGTQSKYWTNATGCLDKEPGNLTNNRQHRRLILYFIIQLYTIIFSVNLQYINKSI